MEGMKGDRQHYLPAALIGGFGERREGKSWRYADIVVRELHSGNVHPGVAQDVAHRRAIYRIGNPPPGVDPDIVDTLWTPVEDVLPALVQRLDHRELVDDDAEKLTTYAAMAGVRHPEAFAARANQHQQERGEPVPGSDQIQVMRVEALILGMKNMPSWRWRVLHSPRGAPRFVISDRGWLKFREPHRLKVCIWLPMGPRVGILGYLDDPELPPRRPPFSEHCDLTPPWVRWFNAGAWSDYTFTHAVFAHPDQRSLLEKAHPAPNVRQLNPFRGQRRQDLTLLG